MMGAAFETSGQIGRAGLHEPPPGAPPAEEPPTSPHPSEVAEMLGLLWRVDHALQTLSKRMLKVLGVTGPQRMIMRIVAREPGVSAGGISTAAQIHPSTLSGILDRLERAQLISRSRDLADWRRARFEVTGAGRDVVDTRRGTVEAAVARSLEGLAPAERAVVKRWFVAFGDELERERVALES